MSKFSKTMDYKIKCKLNYVKNTGIAYADVIYSIATKNNDELTLSAQVYKNETPVGSAVSKVITNAAELNGGSVSLRLPITADGEVTVMASLYRTAPPKTKIAEISRNITNNASFADSARVTLKEGSIFDISEKLGLNYILGIDVARLLQPCYEMHGLTLRYESGVDVGQTPIAIAGDTVERYGGWEMKGVNTWGGAKNADSFTLAGEQMGHWLSAAALFYHDLKDNGRYSAEIKKIEDRMSYLINKLDTLQNTDLPSSAMVISKEYIGGCPEGAFTRCFAGDADWSKDYWVPWYGIHKIYQGLLDVYDYAPYETASKAYAVLKKFTDWAVNGSSSLTDAQLQSVLDVEYGGMNEIFARMFEIIGEEKYLSAARRFTHDKIINPLITNNTASLSGKHANTQIPKFVGAAEIYEQNPVKYAGYKTVCLNFWRNVNYDRCYAIGGNSIGEHFQSEGTEELGVKTCESCNTYNMMRLTEHLFSWEQKSEYFDWYEKALYNHILGQQEPQTGAKMYFVSLLQGHHRIYEKPYESWWCCTGTGMENPARYTRTVYYEDNENDTVYVNLYMAGAYTWDNLGLTLNIETSYPYSDEIKITVSGTSGKSARVKLRAPSWLKSEMTARVNSEKKIMSSGGEYLTIDRTWNSGDVINITIPMEVWTYTPRTENQTVYQYGPIVLAAPLGDCSDEYEQTAVETQLDLHTASAPYIVIKGADNPTEAKLIDCVEAVDTSRLQFKIKAANSSTGKDIPLVPFTEISHGYHNVYWNINSTGDEYEANLNRITIDTVTPDGQQDEMGHGMIQAGEGSNKDNAYRKNSHQGSFSGGGKTYQYRDAFGSTDAFFQYRMKVDSNEQNYLFVRYWGSNAATSCGAHDFKIYVDGTEIARQTLNNNNPDSAYDVFYEIPQGLTDGKENIIVKFAPTSTSCATGRVLNLRITRAAAI